MKKSFFWSPHIDPQVATKKSVLNSLKFFDKFGKEFENSIINVFGEWDDYDFKNIKKINLLTGRNLIKQKFKGFFYSRLLYIKIFFSSYYPLKNILKKEKPDYLISHLITSLPIIMFAINNFETKLILRISGFPKLNFFRFLLWKIASKKIKYVICPTQETRSFLEKKKIFSEEKLLYIPDPILDINQINILKRKELDYQISKPYFLIIGRFTKQKNHTFLLNFFSKNSHYLNDYKLILIGEGELEDDYKKIIQKGNLENKIEILGYKKNVYNYIFNAKCVISSSLWEDPGFIMIESAFLGVPIISSNCPSGPKEFIGKNENGFIFNSNEESSFQVELDNFLSITKNELYERVKKAKKNSKFFTGYYNYKKLSYLLN